FIEGDEFGAQAFVQDGKVEFILPHGDYVFKGDTGVPVGHYAPFETDRACAPDVREQLEKAIAAMKLDNCAINADFIMRDGKTYVLELGGRSGATCLAELVSIYYGFDYYEKILRVALGEHVDFRATKDDSGRPRLTPNASMLLTSDRDGVILSQENRNDPSDPDIVQIQFDYAPGDSVHAFRVGPHRIGHVITKGDTLGAAVEKLHQALEHIDIRVAGEE
ncbi:MAG: carboxylate--amine ligase, partial [Hornefia butyriciproducens]|nr:carboxylate--amine ligase [Hornefia butyriciproducens]